MGSNIRSNKILQFLTEAAGYVGYQSINKSITTILQPFYSPMDLVRGYLGKPVPER